MTRSKSDQNPTACSLAPLLSVRGAASAVEFYKAAFGATAIYRAESPDGSIVAQMEIHGAEFWVSDESAEHGNFSPESLGGGTVRLLLVVPDPDAAFEQALAAGAEPVYPVADAHGWRIGRLVDPFGHHWEIARDLSAE